MSSPQEVSTSRWQGNEPPRPRPGHRSLLRPVPALPCRRQSRPAQHRRLHLRTGRSLHSPFPRGTQGAPLGPLATRRRAPLVRRRGEQQSLQLSSQRLGRLLWVEEDRPGPPSKVLGLLRLLRRARRAPLHPLPIASLGTLCS